MASKKCPKCGEDNPAEAVMCWACYTPLAGAPAMAVPGMTGAPGMAGVGTASRTASGAGSAVGVPAGAEDATVKKGIDPKLIGGGAFLVVAGLIALLVSGTLGSGGGAADIVPTNPNADPAPPSMPAPPTQTTSALPAFNPSNMGASAPPAPVPAPFTLVVPPNPQFATGTAGVLATQRNLSPAQAAGVARFAKNQLTRGGKWASMQICVFSDPQIAQAFGTFQNRRRSAPLQAGDFQQLASQGVWAGTMSYLDVRGRSERVFTPSNAPTSWWASLR